MSPATHFIAPPAQAELTGPALCALCAEQGGCCCATDPAMGHLSFPLSGAEWARLTPWRALATESADFDDQALALAEERAGALAATLDSDALDPANLDAADLDAAGPAPSAPEAGDDCCQPWPNSQEFITSMKALFPREKNRIEQLFPPGKKHLSLRLRADGACVFLGGDGCRLPRPARPWYCRLFPAWMTGLGPSLFTAKGCLIAERAQNPAHGIRLMAADPDELRAIFARLRRDWGLENE
ncbi:hypothetical protein LJC15_06065 [Desulfovibrio sp. OttesenSCG-928-G11]|nr:hypothetical protein [Desulfovibrio sp. OttesenSCG-928-G11]